MKGKRLYELARKGEVIERPPRPVTIHQLDVTRCEIPEVDVRVHCSKGTYIRTLAADVGEALGCGAHLSALRRTSSGSFTLEAAVTMPELKTWDRDAVVARLIPVPDQQSS